MRRLISDAMKQVKATMPLGAPQNRLHIDNIMFFHDARGRWLNRLRGSILYVGIRFPLLQDTGVPALLTNGLGESLFLALHADMETIFSLKGSIQSQ